MLTNFLAVLHQIKPSGGIPSVSESCPLIEVEKYNIKNIIFAARTCVKICHLSLAALVAYYVLELINHIHCSIDISEIKSYQNL